MTEDGWRAAHALEGIRLAGPGAQITVRVWEEVRAFGFSGDDAFFVVGCSPSLAIFRRGSDQTSQADEARRRGAAMRRSGRGDEVTVDEEASLRRYRPGLISMPSASC